MLFHFLPTTTCRVGTVTASLIAEGLRHREQGPAQGHPGSKWPNLPLNLGRVCLQGQCSILSPLSHPWSGPGQFSELWGTEGTGAPGTCPQLVWIKSSHPQWSRFSPTSLDCAMDSSRARPVCLLIPCKPGGAFVTSQLSHCE